MKIREIINKVFTVHELALYVGGKIIGNDQEIITGVANLENAKSGDIAFAAGKEVEKVKSTEASCVLLENPVQYANVSQIIINDPYLAFIKILKIIEDLKAKPETGVHSTSIVSKTVIFGKDIRIGSFVFIGEKTTIGDNTIIFPFAYIGENVKVGNNVIIYPNVTIRENSVIGDNVIIHCGAVIGSDGYSYRQIEGKHVKIPQIGNVVIEDDVEIGANTTIDRSMMGSTRIGKGTKIDNLVHIAHNVDIGENVLLVAQVGIAGSCKIKNNVFFGGQVGVKDHITIEEGAQIGAQSGVIGNISSKEVVWGTPARPLKKVLRSEAYIQKIPDLIKRINDMEEKIKKLENEEK